MPQNYILGGDFNCVLTRSDSTGAPQVSKGLETFVKGFGAKDSWNKSSQNQCFTHYTGRGATRIDRIHLSTSLWALKTSAEIVAAAFTDHNAAIVRLILRAPTIRWGRGRWNLNTTLLQEETLQRFHEQWEDWKRLIPKYRNI
jgi:hypothetical protein